MAGDTGAPHQISLFRSQITTRRFNDESLRILESLLVFKDVKSQIETRSDLKQFLRFESLSIFHEIKYKTVYQKLFILQFFVRAFALIGDTESCLALKYEALLFRDVKSSSDQSLHVSYLEWLNFAHHSLDQGFYSIATQASKKALACFQKKDVADAKTGDFFENARVIEDIKRLKDRAMRSAASGSVQAQAAEYLKRKVVEKSRICSSFRTETKSAASTLFRNGIKKRHARELRKHQKADTTVLDLNKGQAGRIVVCMTCSAGLAWISHIKICMSSGKATLLAPLEYSCQRCQKRFIYDHMEIPIHQRADAVGSLVYEANARVRDPVYGCVGAISYLQNQVSQLQMQLAVAQAEILCIQMQQEPNLPTQLDQDDKSLLLASCNNFNSIPQYFNFASSSNVIQEPLKRESLWT
ncbi:hypothetical protein H0E87_001384 [Populus deltoides]|uniref:LOB domain-containing protein n=1 Tax=Populus deltoides TaxID=3696 RepID=A0A8T2ZRB1_POPDE|nr:hypothetical protein H0E87_001384 [Populus deltoides]